MERRLEPAPRTQGTVQVSVHGLSDLRRYVYSPRLHMRLVMVGIGVSNEIFWQRHLPSGGSIRSYLKTGPVLMTVGPWRPVRLETYTTRIAELDVRTNLRALRQQVQSVGV